MKDLGIRVSMCPRTGRNGVWTLDFKKDAFCFALYVIIILNGLIRGERYLSKGKEGKFLNHNNRVDVQKYRVDVQKYEKRQKR